jgi:hypothetical protein
MDYRFNSHNLPPPRHQDTSWINKPITYSEGPNAGKTIRAAIEEYQQPDLGRKWVHPESNRAPQHAHFELQLVSGLQRGTDGPSIRHLWCGYECGRCIMLARPTSLNTN